MMMLEAPIVRSDAATNSAGRWGQLVYGVVCMVMIANLQYGWTLFVNPIDQKYHWGVPAIQVAFSVFIATETWLVPVEGWFVDRFGPRVVVAFGGIVVAVAWALDSFAVASASLRRRRNQRGRRGCCLRHLRRQCAQMVS